MMPLPIAATRLSKRFPAQAATIRQSAPLKKATDTHAGLELGHELIRGASHM